MTSQISYTTFLKFIINDKNGEHGAEGLPPNERDGSGTFQAVNSSYLELKSDRQHYFHRVEEKQVDWPVFQPSDEAAFLCVECDIKPI